MIYRPGRVGAHSIEGIFGGISEELSKTDDVIDFRCGSRWAMLADAWALRRLKPDVFHVTGDVHFMALLLPRRRTVLTIHDLRSFSERLKGWRRWVFWMFWIWLPVLYAARVVAISEFAREQVRKTSGVRRERITVIENPVSPAFVPVARPFDTDCPTVLHLGTDSNKNLERLIEAVAGMRLCLSIIGPLRDHQKALLDRHAIKYVSALDLTEREVVQRYVDADLVCFASLFEGFGMPIVEAQAVGRPVITSNCEPMVSVAQGAALLVDPTSVAEIGDAVRRICDSAELRADLVAKGFTVAAKRRVGEVADRYREIYASLLPAN